MILSLVMSVGFVAIWHVTIPDKHHNRKMEAMAPLLEVPRDAGIEAQGVEGGEVDGRFVFGD